MQENYQLSKTELIIISSILLFIMLLISFDVYDDYSKGVEVEHIAMELSVVFFSTLGVMILLKRFFKKNQELKISLDSLQKIKKESEKFQNESKKFIEGLSQVIDRQFSTWNLSIAEKEVALLLLKGLSLKEIAEVRTTAEKTVRIQATSIYHKSGLAGRAELSAFFLEDLLSPSIINS
jgi:DNA-binding CsgD family transcriptional regulator